MKSPLAKVTAPRTHKPLDVPSHMKLKEPVTLPSKTETVNIPSPQTLSPVKGKVLHVSTPAPEASILPDFGAFIDKFCAEHGIFFNHYAIVERDKEGKLVFTEASQLHLQKHIERIARMVMRAVNDEFPEWECIEKVENAEHRPPFAVSWEFTKKATK